MEGTREKIINELLNKIEVNTDTMAIKDSVSVFSEFIKALTLEESLLNPDAEVDKLAKQQVEAANEYLKDLGSLFQQQGDHQKEVDEIFVKMTESMAAKVSISKNKANLFPVKGQEFHIYTGNPPDTLDEYPSGILLCKAIFGEKVTIIAFGKASYGLLVKDGQYVAYADIDTIPGKGIMRTDTLNFYKGAYFTIYNW